MWLRLRSSILLALTAMFFLVFVVYQTILLEAVEESGADGSARRHSGVYLGFMPRATKELEYYDTPAPDRWQLGRAAWTLLHAIATNYPENATEVKVGQYEREARNLMQSMSVLFPCHECAEHLRATLRELPVKAKTKGEFRNWMCQLHNRVNDRIGRPLFACGTAALDKRWHHDY